jgi:hypothetical protein
MKIIFNKEWFISTSLNIRMWQNDSKTVFVDVAEFDAQRLFKKVFSVDDGANIYFLKNNAYDYFKVIFDALKDKLVDPHIAYILIRFGEKTWFSTFYELDEKKLGKRRFAIYTELADKYQVSFESTQAMALARAFQVGDLENDPENYIESEVFQLLVDNVDLVQRITREYQGERTFREHSEREVKM